MMDTQNIKNIKALVKIMNESGLTAIELTENDVKVRLEKQPGTPDLPVRAATEIPAPPQAAAPLVENKPTVDFNYISEIKSPMIGVFYACPSEGAPPFVKVGDTVKKNDVLCIIEAMKMMNEIVADTDGEIVDICVKNAEVVEFSQVLFKIY